MHEYSIETDGHGGFQVRVTNPAGEQLVVPAFVTWREASEWVEEQMRLETEALNRRKSGDATLALTGRWRLDIPEATLRRHAKAEWLAEAAPMFDIVGARAMLWGWLTVIPSCREVEVTG